ncbi:hypothetical protein PtA15_11A404 [Puccinia triticina]|uniref:Uncharacterized protein n=1 Tax=Puccinia triticina TaxID=208348 RepID=A0ABY7CZF5_9BASI|nr:uncharacterized protein PtA15_11A404 [Puccinia triticina]WAQ89713.1 hypothetical protein PtA15_11A404 [Puccinia triticina]
MTGSRTPPKGINLGQLEDEPAEGPVGVAWTVIAACRTVRGLRLVRSRMDRTNISRSFRSISAPDAWRKLSFWIPLGSNPEHLTPLNDSWPAIGYRELGTRAPSRQSLLAALQSIEGQAGSQNTPGDHIEF